MPEGIGDTPGKQGFVHRSSTIALMSWVKFRPLSPGRRSGSWRRPRKPTSRLANRPGGAVSAGWDYSLFRSFPGFMRVSSSGCSPHRHRKPLGSPQPASVEKLQHRPVLADRGVRRNPPERARTHARNENPEACGPSGGEAQRRIRRGPAGLRGHRPKGAHGASPVWRRFRGSSPRAVSSSERP